MSSEHEEAAKLALESFRKAENDFRDFNDERGMCGADEAIVAAAWKAINQLAALIADVRRKTREEDARICEDNATGDDSPWHTMGCNECADLIRARLEESS